MQSSWHSTWYKSSKHNSYFYCNSLNMAIDQMSLLSREKRSTLIYAENVKNFLSSIILSKSFFIWFCLCFNWAVVAIQYKLEKDEQYFSKIEQIFICSPIVQECFISYNVWCQFLRFKCLMFVTGSRIILSMVDGYKTYALILKYKC